MPAIAKAVLVVAAIAAIIAVNRIASAKPSAEPSAEYSLDFGPDFKPHLASRDDLGISVVIAVDSSNSMLAPPMSGGTPKYRQASAALTAVVELLEKVSRESPRDQILNVGVLGFDDAVREVMPLTRMDEAGLSRLRAIAGNPDSFRPRNSTAIGDAVARGVLELSRSGTILRSLIVVTDGQNMRGADPARVLEAVYSNRNSASRPEAPVITSSILMTFIGFDIDLGYFKAYEEFGARVASASDQEQLASVLSASLEADITKLEAPSLGSDR